MFSQIRNLLLAGALVAVAGCIEKKQEVTLNPDGSGKVVYEVKQPLDIMGGMSFGTDAPAKEESSEDKAKKEVAKILDSSEGVDAWEDVTYMVEDDGSLRFRGTAYFKSFNDAKIEGSDKVGNSSQVKIDKKGMTVLFKQENKKPGMGGGMPGKKPAPPKLTEKELQKKVKMMQGKMKQSTAMMGAMLSGLKDEVIFHLPGKIDKSNNFKKVDDNTVSISIDGEKIVKVMQEFAKDEEAIKKAILAGEDGPDESYFNEKVLGNSGAVMAHSSKLKPQFDYKKAVEKAKKNYPAMCKKLGIKAKK